MVALVGCVSANSNLVAPDYGKAAPRTVVVQPIQNDTADKEAAEILRQDLADGLYFKGYQLVPTSSTAGAMPGDATFHATLSRCETRYYHLFAPTVVSVNIELKSKAGETIWRSGALVWDISFDFTNYRLARKVWQLYDGAIQKAVDKALKGLPDAAPETPGKTGTM
ncbi:MAG: hypothetical protein PHY31_05290 [Smithellaceae bacterium]|nr:hypothetical protein [Smithellaceae bacterium]